jgi:hypothetical protein
MRALRISLELLTAAAFLGFAAVQCNDPDPLLWILVYLAGAAVLIADAAERLRWGLAAGLAVLTLLASGLLAFRYDKLLPWIEQEFMREAAGLALVGLASGLVALGSYRRSR